MGLRRATRRELRDPQRERALDRARTINALAGPGTKAEGEAARRALRRFLQANDLREADL